MNEKIKYIENVFRNSNNNDELFDAFSDAIRMKIKDVALYKILLGNPALSVDEIIMFTEKLCTDLPNNRFEIYFWTANVFCNNNDYSCIENALKYLTKASLAEPFNNEPYLRAISLYDNEMDLPINNKILIFINEGLPNLVIKSKVYYALAGLHKKIGNEELVKKYSILAEKSAKNEN